MNSYSMSRTQQVLSLLFKQCQERGVMEFTNQDVKKAASKSALATLSMSRK